MGEHNDKPKALWPWVVAFVAVIGILVHGLEDSAPPSTIGLQPQTEGLTTQDSKSPTTTQSASPHEVFSQPDREPQELTSVPRSREPAPDRAEADVTLSQGQEGRQ